MKTILVLILTLIVNLTPTTAQSNTYSKDILENIELGTEILITHKYYSKLEDEVIVEKSLLKILETTPISYNYLYFDKYGVSNITKDSIKNFIYFNGDYYSSRNYYNDFDRPVSSYIHFIELKKSLESLTEGIAEQSISYGETDSSTYTIQSIYLNDLNLHRTLKLEKGKNRNDYLVITKAASQDGVNLLDMWEEVDFRPNNIENRIFDLDRMFLSFNEIVESKAKRKKRSTLEFLDVNYILEGINTKDSKLIELFDSNKYLLVYSWGIWCGPCRLNKKNAIQLSNEVSKEFKFISVNCELNKKYSDKELAEYIKRNKLDFPVYYGCEFLDYFRSKEYPNLLVFNKKLELIGNLSGYVQDVSEYLEFLEQFE